MEDSVTQKAVKKHPQLSEYEKQAILQTINYGEVYGYANLIAWLATAWACNLRDKWNFSKGETIEAVSHCVEKAINKALK